jgi:hypothetical protein
MRTFDPEVDLNHIAAAEAEFVVRRASQDLPGTSSPLSEVGERITRAYDEIMQEAAGSSRTGVDVLRGLVEKDPIRFITVLAAAAFAIGFTLRIWRSSRA